MKTVVFAVLVFLLISQNEALKCYCGGKRQCPDRIETCIGSDSVCISASFYGVPQPFYFKGCYRESDCVKVNMPGMSSASCCRTDLCNR
uniref:Snake toxin/toxin-like domain-containing protein n=1 Tax=Nothobranchius furzeri TaxID=105023 RepID=A0A8C6NPM7_NOTFU